MLRAPLLIPSLLSLALASILLAAPASAAAPGGSNDNDQANYEAPSPERRGGFVASVSTGFGLANLNGYPNEIKAIGDPSKHVETGTGFGSQYGLWAGGHLRDWLAIGGGLRLSSSAGNDLVGGGFGILLHVEAYPLFALGGGFRDLGLSLEGGLGSAVIMAKDAAKGDDPLANGGSMSQLSASVFYEPFRFWHFSTGPELYMSHAFSQTLTENLLTLGWRFSFHGVQVLASTKP